LYAINIWPLGVTAMLSLMALVFTGSIDSKTALSGLANANVVVIVGMFVVAAGLKRTSLIDKIASFIRRVTKGSYRLAYSGVIIFGAIVTSLLTSPMVAYAICFPIMDAVCDEYNVSSSKAQFPLCVVCIACCAILPFGFAISQSAVFNGLLETYGFASNFDAIKFTMGRFPMIFVVILLFISGSFTVLAIASSAISLALLFSPVNLKATEYTFLKNNSFPICLSCKQLYKLVTITKFNITAAHKKIAP